MWYKNTMENYSVLKRNGDFPDGPVADSTLPIQGLGSIPGWELDPTRCMLQLKILNAATKTQTSQIKKYVNIL